MLPSVLSSWVLVEKQRRVIEVFPEAVQKLWNRWELRVMVLISLALQISLIHLGNQRKYNARSWIRIFLWSAYLMADWTATVALGVLSNKQGNSCPCDNNPAEENGELAAFWAPFLLLHLGGPDTITAYALADNELWARHLLGLAVQTSVALYIILLAWNSSHLSFLTIPMLLAGVIKYGERSWVLRSANREQLRDSMLTPPDPGPNYAKFMEEFSLKQAEGFCVEAVSVKEVKVGPDDSSVVDVPNNILDAGILQKAHSLFQTFKRLFVDLILSYQDRDESQSYFQTVDSEKAFKVIEVELGFAYDVFYTKAPIIYTSSGIFFRLISVFSTLVVFVFFVMISNRGYRQYHQIDLIITYILLVGAILLEIYAVVLLLSSDWTNLWLSKNPRTPFFSLISWIQVLSHKKRQTQRWSNWMAQYNFLSFCLKDKPVVCSRILKLLPMYIYDTVIERRRYRTHSPISPHLKGLIFKHFKEKSKNKKKLKSFCNSRGRLVLRNHGYPELVWATRVEFDRSILIWHIATDLCYLSDQPQNCGATATTNSYREDSKHISDYMLYLLVMCPFMLPTGIGMIRFRDTCAEAEEFFRERSPRPPAPSQKALACKMLLQVSTKVLPAEVKGDRSKSVLFDACRLATALQTMEEEEKWKMVSNVWVEILGYAACHCGGDYHARQLIKGGELLTHVWLLMAHLGIAEQFQISQGHARARLSVN